MRYPYAPLCRRVVAVLSTAVLFGLGVAALSAASSQAQDKTDWPQRLTFATGPTGGFAYTMSAPWASTVGSAVDVSISPESTSGIPINVQMLQAKQVEAAVGTSDVVVLGWRGEDFAKGKKMQDVRTMLMFDPYVFQPYVDARSDIKSLSDLNGKVINPSRAGSGTDGILRGLVAALGIEPKSITNVSPAQANDLMADGRVDMAIGTGNIPHPAASQYEARTSIRLIGFTEEEVQKYLADNPQLTRMVIPAGSFKGQDEDVISVGSHSMFIAHKDLPESLVYEMVKATFDNQKSLANAYKAFARLKPKNILLSPIPLHPGAVKYFEEQGIEIPDKLKQS